MATRLNEYNRRLLRDDMLKHRFGAEIKALKQDTAVLAADVYRDLYTKAELRTISDAPFGWFPQVASIQVAFGYSDYVNLAFSGRDTWGLLHALTDDDKVEMPALYKHRTGTVAKYEENTPLGARLFANNAKRKDLIARITQVKATLEATLKRTGSGQALVKAWPEAKPFVEKLMPTAPKQALVVPTADLNRILNLP